MASGAGSFIGSIVGGALTGGAGPAIGEGIKLALPGITDTAKILVDRLVPDPAAREAAQREIEEVMTTREVAAINATMEVAKAQIGVNAIEAQSEQWWKSGWRPAVGWTCVGGCIYGFVIQPLLAWATGILGVAIGAAIPAPPAIDLVQLMGLLFSMLGLGAYRTVEKTKGVA